MDVVDPCITDGTGTAEAIQILFIPAVPVAVPWVPVNETTNDELLIELKVTFVMSISEVDVAAEAQ